MNEVIKWVVKDGNGVAQIYESYAEAYSTYRIMKELGDKNATIEKDKKFLLQE